MGSVIAVGLSGGVDSSVAVTLLSQEWDTLVGVSHFIWENSACCNTETLGRARRICERLDIPYYVIDQKDQFRQSVVEDFVASYIEGETPNPCVRCNERVRFSQFYRLVKDKLVEDNLMEKSQDLFFSTGHYVRKIERVDGVFLRKGIDPAKDQSYMIYRLDPELLPYFVFPLGDRRKEDVVELAGEWDLPSVSVRESQDACFVDGKYTDFIKEFTNGDYPHLPGDIVSSAGEVLGKHRGYIHYTIGQRQGLGLGNGPWYVQRIDPQKNLVIVCRREELEQKTFSLREVHWFGTYGKQPVECGVKVRYNSQEIPGTVTPGTDGSVSVTLEAETTISPGQSAVFYENDVVIGGGIINRNE